MRKVAIIGGLGYLVIFFTGIFANFFVLEELKVVGDEMATLENFQAKRFALYGCNHSLCWNGNI
jgi:hypothetical protein